MLKETKLGELAKAVKFLDENKIYINAVDDSVLKEIDRIITDDQMYEKGEDGDGNEIGGCVYADLTILYKRASGQRYDHFTLRDSGAFHKSVTSRMQGTTIETDADPRKGNDNLFENYGENVIKLGDQGKEKVIGIVRQNILSQIRALLP